MTVDQLSNFTWKKHKKKYDVFKTFILKNKITKTWNNSFLGNKVVFLDWLWFFWYCIFGLKFYKKHPLLQMRRKKQSQMKKLKYQFTVCCSVIFYQNSIHCIVIRKTLPEQELPIDSARAGITHRLCQSRNYP